ncbi:MAG TPA: carboxypeptidase regulatory-like domain-containing protein, partial [Thermoanaerobaculia bacterium]
MVRSRTSRSLLFLSIIVLLAPALFAQQVGSISGRVTTEGQPLPGTTVEARSAVLPQPRVTTTSGNGDYRLPALPPGRYTVTYSLSGMQSQTRTVDVFLNQDSTINVSLGVEAVSESITVTADSPLIDPTSTEVRSEVSEEVIEQVPVGQEYRDLLKLAPAVQYSEDIIRGPSAGGSGQDNTYMFDGVNVTLPLYGTLSAEPSSHDIEQVSVVKGGAKAVDFNRAAGFTIDSVSKSGTNEWKGEVEYQIQNADFTAEQDFAVQSIYDQDRDWLTFGIGGPILRDRLFFYGSYYRPTTERDNSSNVYGELPNLASTRNEYFGKLTFTPTGNLLLHGSYRDSTRDVLNAAIDPTESPMGSETQTSGQEIGILEGSWVLGPRSFVTFKFNDYANLTSSIADFQSSAVPSRTLGTTLGINNLDQLGRFVVPSTRANSPAYNEFVQPLIDRYGYLNDQNVRTGGGFVGGATSAIDNIDFFRRSGQVAFDITLGSAVAHDLHFGYQRFEDAEELLRTSNGWGIIDATSAGTVNCPAGTECAGQPYFYHAEFLRSFQGLGSGLIRSEYHSDNFEINDTIRMGNWSFNAGVLFSNDKLYGQGLREDDSVVSGFVSAPGNRYLMYEVPWEKQIQPRLGATWAYNSRDTVYASYSRYNPSVSSLPRAASWDRNAFSQLIDVYFDQNGTLIGSRERGGSSGKLFVEDMDPRYTDEYLLGTSRQIAPQWAARAYARYRYSTNFWEDT